MALDDESVTADVLGVPQAAARFGTVEDCEELLPLQHVFTHYRLHIHPFQIGLGTRAETPAGYVWWELARIDDAALPAPVKKLLGQLGMPSLFS